MKIPFDGDEAADAFFDELLAAVDQQLQSPDTPYVSKTFKRLLTAGLDEGEAREAIARCLAEITDQVVRSGRPFDADAYRISLERINPGS
ncbi:hypothetical protein [Haloferula rosea]|uniref:Uncharacterized protein n=1 Tax=Haloferula rosea TaxID=490093 RepID=A0A934RAS3_9BACT|nr:hypothetical protein [Haloferula rosea]MBK1826182.1 hypothetical protein [Haloferula rosea]